MTQAEALYHLQEIDLSLLRQQKRLSEIEAALADNQTVVQAQTAVNTAHHTLTPLKTRSRDLELEIQSTLQKAQATEQELYSGKVKNPKQLQEMEQEIQALRKRHADLEDALLGTMLSVEEAEARLAEAEDTLRQATTAHQADHQHLLDEREQLQAQVATLRQQRELAVRQIAPENLTLYNTLRPKKHNQPVALLQNGSCSLCGVEQTTAITLEALHGQSLVKCLSCGRILVYRG